MVGDLALVLLVYDYIILFILPLRHERRTRSNLHKGYTYISGVKDLRIQRRPMQWRFQLTDQLTDKVDHR